MIIDTPDSGNSTTIENSRGALDLPVRSIPIQPPLEGAHLADSSDLDTVPSLESGQGNNRSINSGITTEELQPSQGTLSLTGSISDIQSGVKGP